MRGLVLLGAVTLGAGTVATAAGPHAGGEGTGDIVPRLDWKGADTLDWAIHQHGILATVIGARVRRLLVPAARPARPARWRRTP